MATLSSGIRDNHQRGSVGDFLKEKIRSDASLSFVSAYFTIYAFESLKPQLQNINHLDFLFGEPRFIRTLDPDKTDKKFFKIVDEKLELAKRLYQKQLAKECADWIRSKVDIRSLKQSNLLHGKMYHVRCDGVDDAIVGSSNFTVKGLGLGANSNPVGRISRYPNPDSIRNPKKRLTKIFTQELGSGRRYVDYQHAIMIAREIPDFKRIRRSDSFKRFALKVVGFRL